ncbi:MAG: DNA mismatch repair protein MutT, partial [Clostridia bacterium]|nr:DNA mismatch repair protein MutT [Clostridia bacterium]
LTLTKWQFRGIVTFSSDQWETEYMHLFTATDFSGEVNFDCNEGELAWVDKDKLSDLPMWEGDRIFFDLIDSDEAFFSLKLSYEGSRLSSAFLNGKKLEL